MRKVPENQVLERFQRENPWWEGEKSVQNSFGQMKPRPYIEHLYPLISNLDVRRAVVLMGPRRVGKTVLLHHVIQRLVESGVNPRHICYVSVDHPLFNGLGLEEFLQHYRDASGVTDEEKNIYLFFDEIQYLRDWEIHLKTLVDSSKYLKITVSGSAAAALRLKSRESGAGRFTDFLLPPLTFFEYMELLGLGQKVTPSSSPSGFDAAKDIADLNKDFLKYLNFGGYPEVVFSRTIQEDPGRFIKSDIIDKVLLRDLPSLYGVHDIQELNSLFTTLAFNSAGEVSLEELSKGSGVAKNTIKRYLEYLEAAFLIRLVHRVDRNAKRFARANFFKVYLTNPSMRAALFSPVFDDSKTIGSLVETAIFSQWFHSRTLLHYARWNSGEVDIVNLGSDQKPEWALEAKWSDRIVNRPTELKGLVSFCKRHELDEALVTTKTMRSEGRVDEVRLNFVPASEYCYTLGRNILREGPI